MARATLFVVHGSHPCRTVELAMQLKHLAYRKVELPPAAHAPVMLAYFGRRTVPGLQFPMGGKVQGSREILRALDLIAPEPPLLPEDADARRTVLDAEAWGDDVLQPLVRRVLWQTLGAHPEAGPSFTAGGRLPLPAGAVTRMMPAIAWAERRLNRVSDDAVAADLRELPRHLERIDNWIAEGVLGGDPFPNAADLQIAPSLNLLSTMADLDALIAPRPAGALARRVDPQWRSGSLPAGAVAGLAS
jgi:glutathione S-transferase